MKPAQFVFKGKIASACRNLVGINSQPEIDRDRSAPIFRPGTNDASVWRSVVDGNEYFVPPVLSLNDVVIDVGMHIGSFSYLVLSRGAGRVYGFEANKENCALARRNLTCFGNQMTTVYGAVCRSDSYPSRLFFSGYRYFVDGVVNTGGGDVFSSNGRVPVPSLPFDSIIDSLTDKGGQRIRLLKLDCEGSEYPILMTSNRLHLIDEIVGEYHEMGPGCDRPEVPPLANVGQATNLGGQILADYLHNKGFAVRLGYRSHVWGKFLAWNKACYDSVLG